MWETRKLGGGASDSCVFRISVERSRNVVITSEATDDPVTDRRMILGILPNLPHALTCGV